jgi:ubiquinone/menaquinone biosynthesis C-methylase UbiE
MLSADEANRQYFREAYRTGEHGWAMDEPSAYAVAFLKRLKRLVPGGTLLDVGCGEGRHSLAAARLGFKVTAIDYEPLALRRARRFARLEGVKSITFRNADVLHMSFRDSRFDIILDHGCLHHQRKGDWPAYMVSILRVLKSRGYYVLSVFSPRFYMFRGSRKRWHIAYGAYRRCFTRKDIADLFSRYFRIIEIAEERDADRGFWHALMRRRDGPAESTSTTGILAR